MYALLSLWMFFGYVIVSDGCCLLTPTYVSVILVPYKSRNRTGLCCECEPYRVVLWVWTVQCCAVSVNRTVQFFNFYFSNDHNIVAMVTCSVPMFSSNVFACLFLHHCWSRTLIASILILPSHTLRQYILMAILNSGVWCNCDTNYNIELHFCSSYTYFTVESERCEGHVLT